MPFRRVLSVFISAIFVLLDLPGCGHQVTPDRTTSLLTGKMSIRFRTNAAMNFSKYAYAMIFDTCAPGSEPYPNVFATTFTNYSYAWVISGSSVQAILYEYVLTSGQIQKVAVIYTPSDVQLQLNSNGLNSEFTLTFPRSLLNNPLGPTIPNNGCPTGNTPPLTYTTTWFVNFFTIDQTSNSVLDTLGLGGASDTSYSASYDTTVSFQNQVVRQGSSLASDPAAGISGGEIDNFI